MPPVIEEALIAVGIIAWYLWEQAKSLSKKPPEERRAGMWKLGFVAFFLITLALVTGGFALAGVLHLSGPIAIVVAGFLDALDGRVARMTNTSSEFGVQYDSLSDMVAFGVAPAILMFSWALSSLGKVGNINAAEEISY